jgi:hypothetical protein
VTLGLDQNQFSPWTGSKVIHLTLKVVIYSYDIYWYEPLLLRISSNCVDLKSSPVLIVGFKILLKIPSLSYVCIGPPLRRGGELSQKRRGG